MNDKRLILGGILLTLAFVGQIALAIWLYDPNANPAVINTGWFLLMLSAVFGWLPIITFRLKGKVQGRSYIHTTVLVDSGVYAIVRHPQYLAGILIAIALPLITQHWSVVVTGLVGAAITYIGTYDEERGCIEKFGDAYRQYQQKVPRMNFILGIVRWLLRAMQKS
jgi:protein-S-isoprenylcysteine O-methyltransferase Ste14